MLCPIDLTAALVLALIYPFLCKRHKAMVRNGLRTMRRRVKLLLRGSVVHEPTLFCGNTCMHPPKPEIDMDKLAAATTRNWTINGIEFTVVDTAPDGSLLVEGIVQNPEHADVWFFGHQSYEASEVRELVDAGYLEIFWPDWCDKETGCFVIRLKLDDRFKFPDGSAPARCVICDRDFPFINNGDNLIETAPATGPTYSCGGTPAEWEPACTECINFGPEEDEMYECDFDDDERGR